MLSSTPRVFHAECWEVRLLCDNVWLQHFWGPPLNCLILASSMTKPTIRLVQPAKPQISQHICRVWSEYLLIACAFYSLKAVQRGKQEPLPYWVAVQADLILFVLRFYGPVNPIGSCRARSVGLTTRLLGRFSPLSSYPVLCTFFRQKLTTALLESAGGREWP